MPVDDAHTLDALIAFLGVALAVGAVLGAFLIFLWWRIFSKAGYSGALALIFLGCLVPVIGPFIVIGLIGWFAFADWPVLKKARGDIAPN